MKIDIKKLPSGCWLIRGEGPCNWAQPPCWPCRALILLEHTHREAGEEFIIATMEVARKLFDEEPHRSRVEADFDYYREIHGSPNSRKPL